MPQLLKFGGRCSLSLPAVLRELGLSRPLVITDAFIAGSGLLAPIQSALEEAKLPAALFSGCVPDPTTDSVAAGLAAWEAAGQARPDCLVAVGGGSSIDTAKAIALLAVAKMLVLLINFYTFAILIQAVMSWFGAAMHGPAASLLYTLNEPLLHSDGLRLLFPLLPQHAALASHLHEPAPLQHSQG